MENINPLLGINFQKITGDFFLQKRVQINEEYMCAQSINNFFNRLLQWLVHLDRH